jgi:hypothetical protein
VASSRRGSVGEPPAHGWIAQAWKWGAGSLSAGAALVSIISSVREVTGTRQVRWIGVAPAADTAWSIGDTVQLATTITDAHGGMLPGLSVGWTSTDSSIATVDSAGAVVARAAGAATIVAAAGGRLAQSRILVRQRPAAIRVLGDTVLRLPEGSVTRLIARVVDARQHPVPGQTITWRSADPPIASIDSAARVTASLAGPVLLTAVSDGISAELPLEIYPVPATITLLTGDGQRAPAGRPLPGAIRAQVVSRGGRPMPGVAVRFRTGDDAGRLDQEADTSDADGILQVRWTLSSRPGRQRLVLATDDVPPIVTLVVAEAEPVAENTRITVVDSALSGPAGTALPALVAVRVADSLGTPLAEVPVRWQTAGGEIEPEGTRTDSLGGARARWTLGTRSGVQQAYVLVGASRVAPRAVLTATALPGPAAALAVLGRTGAPGAAALRGQAGRPLVPAVELRVTDRTGNPVPGATVALRPLAGSVAVRAPVSDSLGKVAVSWTLGPTVGSQRLVASVRGVERTLELTAEARHGSAASTTVQGLPPSGTAGRTLPRPVVVSVTDSFGNAVSGALVVLTARAGRVVPARVRTDKDGHATVRWTLGAGSGEQRLEATVKGGGSSGVAKIRAVQATAIKRQRPASARPSP